MADIFDIANLITTVGVEAVKIKQEPGLPEKSSNEILTELFSTFDADEGIASPVDEENSPADKGESKTTGHARKKKKSKKKHKHKDKKHKKKGKRNSSESDSDDDAGSKKKKKHKKKSKRTHSSYTSEASDSDEPNTKKRKNEVKALVKCKIEAEDANEKSCRDDAENQSEATMTLAESRNLGSPVLPPMVKKTRDDDDEASEPGIPRLLEKAKQQTQKKILIMDLKNSAVYNETVKEVETRRKEKAARMEDGEISDSSSYNRTPTLSPTPPLNLDSQIDSPVQSPLYGNTPPSPGPLGAIKKDLRLVLKEREKKKFGGSRKSENRDSRDTRGKTGRDDRSNKDSRRRITEHNRRSQSRGRKNTEFSGRSSHHRSRSGTRENHRRSDERRDRSDDKRSGRSRDRRKHNKDDLDGRRSRSEDRHKEKHGRPRSRSKERKERIEIDKKKLLEIARRNAINMIKQGALPLAQQDKAIAAIQAGGKSVDELTDFCKSLSKSEALGELSSISSDDDGNNSEKGFHHPFILRERPTSIIMNIKDAKQLPNKTFQEKNTESSTQLTLKFPVSSGQHHRKTESEWIPVVPKKPEAKKLFVPAASKPMQQTFAILPPIAAQSLPQPVSAPAPLPVSAPAPIPVSAPAPMALTHAIAAPQPPVFPQPPVIEPVDIGSIVSQRLAAMRRLRENPHDVEALSEMYHAQNGMKNWAESKQMPGQFIGSTGVKVLSPAELHSGYQAWARKDQLVSAAPVSGGMGMALLQKMGWRPGEGLGKNKEGTLVPLQLEVKLDKKGLVSEQDIGQKCGKIQKPVAPIIKSLEGKHPVSLLGEYCSKRKFGAPVYELCFECGPDHKKNFLFKVKVNGIEYKPTVASPNKKQAKAEAAQVCLQTLGLLST